MANVQEAPFVIDQEQRIVEWSDAASALLGVSAEAALGRPCYEAVGGVDSAGRAVCQPRCPGLKALGKGALFSSSTLWVQPGTGGPPFELRCELTALPQNPGGAVGRLRARCHQCCSAAEPAAGRSPEGRHAPAKVLSDLSALAALTTSLSPASFRESLERALDILREATGAEAAELWLVEPRGRGMVLTACRGPFADALSQITRFQPGEGYPGLVLARRRPILTRNLPDDPRYLRTRVKEKGVQSYVCVPLTGPQGVIGSLHVASQRSDLDVPRAFRLLSWASAPLSLICSAMSLSTRQEAAWLDHSANGADPETHLKRLTHRVLQHLVKVGRADAGAFFSTGNGPGQAWEVTDGHVPPDSCPGLKPGASEPCPALAGGRSLVLHGARGSWPRACQRRPCNGSVAYCFPLALGKQVLGIVHLSYRAHTPSPPTRYLWTLEEAGQVAARIIADARDRLEGQQRTEAATAQQQKQPAAGGPAGRSAKSPAHEALPYLDIRCFGLFELYRQGMLVTPDQVRRRKALTLLKVLLGHDGRALSRDTLIEMLWPEADPKAGVGRLYVVLHELRRLVEPSSSHGEWVFIQKEGDRYYFNLGSPCRVDVAEFKRLVAQGHKAEAKGESREAVVAYERAVELYRGDFLEDERFADWCWQEREHLRETCLDVLRRLVALAADAGHWQQSVKHLRRALQIDHLREETHRELMRSLWVAGRRDEALRQYETCQEMLRRELDVDPLPETERLLEAIRRSPRPPPGSALRMPWEATLPSTVVTVAH